MCLRYLLMMVFALGLSGVPATSSAQTYRFDFGSPEAAEGFQAVTSSMTYSPDRGYGFEPGAVPVDEVRKKGSKLTRDFVTSTGLFCFSVKLPEGNYKVTLTLGDTQGTSCTTVKSEVRRLMMESLQTGKGETLTVSFGVNVRTPQLSKGNAILQHWGAMRSRFMPMVRILTTTEPICSLSALCRPSETSVLDLASTSFPIRPTSMPRIRSLC